MALIHTTYMSYARRCSLSEQHILVMAECCWSVVVCGDVHLCHTQVRAHPVPLPAGALIVGANSLTPSAKAETASTRYAAGTAAALHLGSLLTQQRKNIGPRLCLCFCGSVVEQQQHAVQPSHL